MDINKIVDNSTKTVTNPLKSNRAIEVYPDKFIANKFIPTKDIKLNNNIKSNNKISNLDREIERIKKIQELKNIDYLTDKSRNNNNLSTYINFDKINKILNDENIHINKDAIPKPVEIKQIEETEHSQYSILDSLKHLTNFKTSKDGLPDKAKEDAKEVNKHLHLIKKCYNDWSKKDIYKFVQDLLKEFNLDLPFEATENFKNKKTVGACDYKIEDNGVWIIKNYKLNKNNKAFKPEMQLEIILHELFHAKGNGVYTGIDKTFDESIFKRFEDIFAEYTSHYILDELGIKEKVPFAYSNILIEMLPELKKLSKFKDCNNVYDFGKIGFEFRFSKKSIAPWKSMYKDLEKVENSDLKFDTIKYAIDNEYIDKMSSQENINYVAPIIAKLYEDSIEAKFYLLKDLNKTLEKVKQNNNLNETEIDVFNHALILIMDKEGIKPKL